MHHYHYHTGRPCICRYGQLKQHLANTKEAASTIDELRKLRNSQDKKLATPEGQDFLNRLEREMHIHPYAEHVQGLIPWIAHRWKKGDVFVKDPEGYTFNRGGLRMVNLPGTENVPPNDGPLTQYIPRLANWFNARNHPLRRGVNIMEHDAPTILTRAGLHEQEMEEKRTKERLIGDLNDPENFNVAHEFPDGWKIVSLPAHALEHEGAAMEHCIGDLEQPSYDYSYADAASDGVIHPYSLRDPQGWPHLTFHLDQANNLLQMQGKADHEDAKKKYRGRADTWLKSIGVNPNIEHGDDDWVNQAQEEQEPEYDELIHIPGATDIQQYLDNTDPYYSPHEEAYKHALYGYEPGETELTVGSPNYQSIGRSLTRVDPAGLENLRDIFYKRMLEHAHPADIQQFENGINDKQSPYTVTDERMFNRLQPSNMSISPNTEARRNTIWNEWQTMKDQHTHPETGELMTPEERQRFLNDQQPRMFDQNSYKDWVKQSPTDPYAWAPMTASVKEIEPTYYRFTFSPLSGNVHIRHNQMNTVDTHRDLEHQLGEKDLVHGFAYKIKGGWRLTNDEHRKLDDSFISNQVIKALRNDKAVNWEKMEDLGPMHYGRRLTWK